MFGVVVGVVGGGGVVGVGGGVVVGVVGVGVGVGGVGVAGVAVVVVYLTSQQHASVSQGRIRSDKFTCCHTEKEVADQSFYLTQSHYTDNGPTSPSTDPVTPGAWPAR